MVLKHTDENELLSCDVDQWNSDSGYKLLVLAYLETFSKPVIDMKETGILSVYV